VRSFDLSAGRDVAVFYYSPVDSVGLAVDATLSARTIVELDVDPAGVVGVALVRVAVTALVLVSVGELTAGIHARAVRLDDGLAAQLANARVR
jgi:hypothetical protein